MTTQQYTLYHGDCLDIMPTLELQSVDVIIADIPYGTTACKWDSVIPFAPMWACIKRVIKPRGAVVLFGSQPFTSALVMSNPKWFKYEIIWEKDRATGFLDAMKRPLKAHENIMLFASGQTTFNPQKTIGHKPANHTNASGGTEQVYRSGIRGVAYGKETTRYPRSVQRFNTVNSAHKPVHPTQKPVALLEYLVRTYTNEGEIVLDFTMGSGSTGVAALNTGRRFIGIEKEQQYFDIAADRIAAVASAPQQLQMEAA